MQFREQNGIISLFYVMKVYMIVNWITRFQEPKRAKNNENGHARGHEIHVKNSDKVFT